MSSENDRIPVPTNGRRPKPVPAEPAVGPAAEPFPAAPAALPTVAFTPTQLAVGFGIVASLVLLVAGRIRRRGRSGRGRFGGR